MMPEGEWRLTADDYYEYIPSIEERVYEWMLDGLGLRWIEIDREQVGEVREGDVVLETLWNVYEHLPRWGVKRVRHARVATLAGIDRVLRDVYSDLGEVFA